MCPINLKRPLEIFQLCKGDEQGLIHFMKVTLGKNLIVIHNASLTKLRKLLGFPKKSLKQKNVVEHNNVEHNPYKYTGHTFNCALNQNILK